tara:strand:- start:85873 stop:86292 length:420 start_codon:yes stop_codon:yes gene_type:complete
MFVRTDGHLWKIARIGRNKKCRALSGICVVLCSDRSVKLSPAIIDLAFVYDTSHHFESPNSTLASIPDALKPGGMLVVADFKRIPGESREFLLNHVRAGKEVFRSEIESAGFEVVKEADIAGFEENYFLKFRKVAAKSL